MLNRLQIPNANFFHSVQVSSEYFTILLQILLEYCGVFIPWDFAIKNIIHISEIYYYFSFFLAKSPFLKKEIVFYSLTTLFTPSEYKNTVLNLLKLSVFYILLIKIYFSTALLSLFFKICNNHCADVIQISFCFF